MQNRTINPMHPGIRHSYGDDAPFAPAGDEAQSQLLNDALAIGHAPSIAAALGLVARVRGTSGLGAAPGCRPSAQLRQNGKNIKFGVQPHAPGIFAEIAARPRGNSNQLSPRHSR